MVRVMLFFSKKIAQKPITSQIIIDYNTPINILSARITSLGGEMLVEMNSRNADKIIAAFRERGVVVDVSPLIGKNDDLCIDCGGCVSICPADALYQGEDYSIKLDPEKCNGVTCGLCLDSCPRSAIQFT